MAEYWCKDCDHNNNGWCKLNQRQGLKGVAECNDKETNGIKILSLGNVEEEDIQVGIDTDDTPPWEAKKPNEWETRFKSCVTLAIAHAERCASVADAGKIYASVAQAIAKSGLIGGK